MKDILQEYSLLLKMMKSKICNILIIYKNTLKVNIFIRNLICGFVRNFFSEVR